MRKQKKAIYATATELMSCDSELQIVKAQRYEVVYHLKRIVKDVQTMVNEGYIDNVEVDAISTIAKIEGDTDVHPL